MSDDIDDGLEEGIAGVYGGPLEEFVQRRDALAKELRAAGKRESVPAVKALKKPSRVAWALNLAVLESPDAIDAVVTAVATTVEARIGGRDVKAAILGLRAAVHELAGHAARAAERAGHRAEPGVLANAVFAVLGRAESFEQLRRGHLADVPEGGGLDLLTNLPAPSQVQSSRPAPANQPAAAAAPATSSSPERAALEAAAREKVLQTVSELALARDRSAATEESLRDVESKLRAAELRLQKAEQEARTLRSQRDQARQEADTAATKVNEAEEAAADAEQRLKEVRGGGA